VKQKNKTLVEFLTQKREQAMRNLREAEMSVVMVRGVIAFLDNELRQQGGQNAT